jgi:hypothetical protein
MPKAKPKIYLVFLQIRQDKKFAQKLVLLPVLDHA